MNLNLRSIYIDGFRNVSETCISFNQITAVVGINNFGKTNLLSAIQFGKRFIDVDSKTKSRMMRAINVIPINNYTDDKNYVFNMEFCIGENENRILAKYEYEFEWLKSENNDGARIVSEILSVKKIEDKRYTIAMKREGNYFKYKTTEKTRLNKQYEILNNELAINKLCEEKGIFYIEVVNAVRDMKFEFDAFANASNAFNIISISDENNEDKFTIDREGSNICEIIYHLKEEYNHKYNILMDAYKKVLPSIEYIEPICINPLEANNRFEDIPFKIPNNIYTINVKERSNNQETSIKYISTGSKRILMLLTAIIISDINKINLIMFEELENSIHPSLFQRLLVVLNQLAGDCNIIITSHSPYLIQYMNMDNIYIGLPDEKNIAQFKRVKVQYRSKIMSLARKQGVTLGDYIFELLLDSVYDNEELLNLLER